MLLHLWAGEEAPSPSRSPAPAVGSSPSRSLAPAVGHLPSHLPSLSRSLAPAKQRSGALLKLDAKFSASDLMETTKEPDL